MGVDRIFGFCRFSFLGRGDWKDYRNVDGEPEELLAKIAKDLYAPERLAQRLEAFRTLTSASIAAQSDKNFEFIVLTSPELPEWALEELRKICKGIPQIKILVSGERTTSAALRPLIARAMEEHSGHILQFRLDDDDAIAVGHVSRLRAHGERLSDLPSFAISMAKGAMVVLKEGNEPAGVAFDLPFLGAGVAVSSKNKLQIIFERGHFALSRRFTHIVDRQHPAALVLKWDHNDSRPLDLEALPSGHTLMDRDAFERYLRSEFPFLRIEDLARIQQARPPAHISAEL